MQSKKRVEDMLPTALKQVENKIAKNGVVESKYFAYVASFGVSVLQSGAFATKLFYDNGDRKVILETIKNILQSQNYNRNIEDEDKDALLDASTALKLAIRTFKKVDNKEEAQNE